MQDTGDAVNRIPEVDELKGVAILLVIYYHAIGVVGGADWLHAEVGVDVFLLLSGFALTVSKSPRNATAFFRRRMLRIFPAYWFAIVLVLVMDRTLRNVSHSWHAILLHATGLHAFGPQFDFWNINMSFWFMGLLIPLYALFFVFRSRFNDAGTVMGWGLLAGAISSLIYDAIGYHGHVEHLTVRIPSFFAGIAWGLLSEDGARWKRPGWILGLGVLGCTMLEIACGDRFYYPIGGVVVVVSYYALRPLLPRAVRFLFNAAGRCAYEVYLLHQPLIRDYNRLAWQRWFGVAEPSKGQLIEGVFAGIVAAWILAVLFRAARRAIGRSRNGQVLKQNC